jgi:hypothetical protein
MPSVEITNAMWAGDVETLHEIAPCRCCCHEHTFEGCPARQWFGCRGNGVTPEADCEAWQKHYEQFHGMTREQFFDWS